MAGPAPKTRDWMARENAHKPTGLHVIVTGLVQVTNTNQEPELAESAERDPRHLGLTLTIKTGSGPGSDVMCQKAARFHKEVSANQYDSVTIRWEGTSIAQVKVIDDTEQGQAADTMMARINATHGKAKKPASKPAAPAKPKAGAPKAPAAKKVAPKKAKKAAPKKAKKAKKAAKKSKKTAKKAVTARVVRAVGGWAKGASMAVSRVIGTKKAKKKGKKKR